ncbi:MAG: M16 family metallopeptidase, partial [Christensenellales bacterium]
MAKLIRLEDGLKIFYERHKNSAAFALGVFVGAGCFYETKETNGISHFIEHTVFKGTEKRTAFDIANETDKCGVTLNAYTSRDLTAFYTVGLSEYAEKCADILSDLLFNATFTEENLEKEKGVVIEEIKMYED